MHMYVYKYVSFCLSMCLFICLLLYLCITVCKCIFICTYGRHHLLSRRGVQWAEKGKQVQELIYLLRRLSRMHKYVYIYIYTQVDALAHMILNRALKEEGYRACGVPLRCMRL